MASRTLKPHGPPLSPSIPPPCQKNSHFQLKTGQSKLSGQIPGRERVKVSCLLSAGEEPSFSPSDFSPHEP